MFNVYGTRVSIQEGDLLHMPADGLVIAANDHLWMGGGPGLRVKQAGGEAIEVDAVRQGPVNLGAAVATPGGETAFRKIFHAVVMGQDLKVRHEHIGEALGTGLRLASREGIETLLIAPLESEELTGPFHDAAHAVATTLFEKLGDLRLKNVVLAVSRDEAREAYRAAILRAIAEQSGGR